jgi:hypothetical protein
MNISQIRGYSYVPSSYPNYQVLTSSSYCGAATPSPSVLWQGLLIDENGCNLVFDGTPPYYNIVFDVARYVHAVTLIGHAYGDFFESINWVVTLGNATGASITQNTIVGQYQNWNFDRFGKEMIIGAYG